MPRKTHTARHLILHGKVQGVFYRDWTVETARGLGLEGWVRNLPDGTVEAYLEGDGTAVARMIEAMRDGPPRARVDRIEQSDADAQGCEGFERR
ncbi:acylphosphatase [Alteriqipengyuania sp. 357]